MSYPPSYQSGPLPQPPTNSTAVVHNDISGHQQYNQSQMPMAPPLNPPPLTQMTTRQPRIPLPSNNRIQPDLVPGDAANGTNTASTSISSNSNSGQAQKQPEAPQRLSKSIIDGTEALLKIIEAECISATKEMSDKFHVEKGIRNEERARRKEAEQKLKKLEGEYNNLFQTFMRVDMEMRKLQRDANAKAKGDDVDAARSSSDSPTSPQHNSYELELYQYKSSLLRLSEEYQYFRVHASTLVAKASDTINKLAAELQVYKDKGRTVGGETAKRGVRERMTENEEGDVGPEVIVVEDYNPQTQNTPYNPPIPSSPKSPSSRKRHPNTHPAVPTPAKLEKDLKSLNDDILAASSLLQNTNPERLLELKSQWNKMLQQELVRKDAEQISSRETDNGQTMYLEQRRQSSGQEGIEIASVHANVNPGAAMDRDAINVTNAEIDAAVANALGFPPFTMSIGDADANKELLKSINEGSTLISASAPVSTTSTPARLESGLRVVDVDGLPGSSRSDVGGSEQEWDKREEKKAGQMVATGPTDVIEEVGAINGANGMKRGNEEGVMETHAKRPRLERNSVTEQLITPFMSSIQPYTKSKSIPNTPISTMINTGVDSIALSTGQTQPVSTLEPTATLGDAFVPSSAAKLPNGPLQDGVSLKKAPERINVSPDQAHNQTQRLLESAASTSSFVPGFIQSSISSTIPLPKAPPANSVNTQGKHPPETSNSPTRIQNPISTTPTTPTTPVSPNTVVSNRAKMMEAARSSMNAARVSGSSLIPGLRLQG